MRVINRPRLAAIVLFGIGAAVYVAGTCFGHGNHWVAVFGLGVQLVGVVLMMGDMFTSWRARRSRTPLR